MHAGLLMPFVNNLLNGGAALPLETTLWRLEKKRSRTASVMTRNGAMLLQLGGPHDAQSILQARVLPNQKTVKTPLYHAALRVVPSLASSFSRKDSAKHEQPYLTSGAL